MLTVVALLALLAGPTALAQTSSGRSASTDTVLVSRRALTISLVLDTSTSVTRDRPAAAATTVTLDVDIRRLSSSLRLQVVAPVNASTYRDPLRPVTCAVLTDTFSCRDSTTVELANGRLVITVRDSATLALLFAGRPARMMLNTPLAHRGTVSRVVRYVDPQLLPPSNEALAEYDRALGRDGWGPWTRHMWTSSYAAIDTVWMQVGERATAYLGELQCRPIDSCNSRADFSASGWTSSDSSVVAVEPLNYPGHVSATIIGLHPGRSTVAVEGLHGPSDDLPRSTRVRTLTRQIIVTNRLARVQITPRPATIVAGSTFDLTARVIDETGVAVVDASVNFLVIYDWPDTLRWSDKRYGLAKSVDLTTPGHRRFIATFGKLADTLDVQIVPR